MTLEELSQKEEQDLTEAINEAADILLQAWEKKDTEMIEVFAHNINEHVEWLSETRKLTPQKN